MNNIDFEKFIDQHYGEAKGCDDRSHHLGTDQTKNITETIELTISLRKTKYFDDTKESYLRLYNKLIDYIKIEITDIICHKHVFEYGTSNHKLHLHASIGLYIPVGTLYNTHGLVEQCARFLCLKTRRIYSDANKFHNFPRYESIPFTLQLSSRSDYWDRYIEKDTEKNAL